MRNNRVIETASVIAFLVALVFSILMRLQLGWPNTFSIIDPASYLQFVTIHGMIMVIYLLTALFLGGFGNYLIHHPGLADLLIGFSGNYIHPSALLRPSVFVKLMQGLLPIKQ